MADNTRVFVAGAGDDIRTRDRAGPKTQVVSVDVAGAGEAELLGAGPRSSTLKVQSAGMTVTGGTPYTAGDVLGTELVLPGASRAVGRGCQIVSAVLLDQAQIGTQSYNGITLALYVFDSASTPPPDNAPQSWTDANLSRLVGIIGFASLEQSIPLPLNRICRQVNPAANFPTLPMVATPVGTSLYATLVCLQGVPSLPAAAAGAFEVHLGIVAD